MLGHMSDKLSKLPLYKWPNRPFWLIMTPLLLLSWLGVMFYEYPTLVQMTSHERALALIILGILFLVVASLRYAKRKKEGL